MTTCLGKRCSFGLPRVPIVNCCNLCIKLLCPRLRRSCGSILVSDCPCVCACVHACVRPFVKKKRACQGFEISYMDSSWKNSWRTFFFSCPCYLHFWSYALLKKSEWNLMHAISYERCMLGFCNFIYGFLMEK